jgi:excisionase family DNA binding protein
MEALKTDITKLYSITDYAKLLGVTRQTVYNWIADKERNIKVVTISGRPFIKISA